MHLTFTKKVVFSVMLKNYVLAYRTWMFEPMYYIWNVVCFVSWLPVFHCDCCRQQMWMIFIHTLQAALENHTFSIKVISHEISTTVTKIGKYILVKKCYLKYLSLIFVSIGKKTCLVSLCKSVNFKSWTLACFGMF